MSESQTERKARGAFFTPPAITRFLAEWAVRNRDDAVLEPSCGEAEFLLAAADRLRGLGAGLFAGETLHGIELHRPSCDVAGARVRDSGFLAEITTANFFDVPARPAYDVVIGNPPYVRYQDFSGDARSKGVRAALRQGVRINGLASSWAAFVIHASAFLNDQGRLGLVLPAELLTVKYARPVRRFLLRRFASTKLVMFEELVFPGVQEEVVLLLAEGRGAAPFFEIYQARDSADLPAIDDAEWRPYAPGSEDKWTSAVVRPDALGTYNELLTGSGFETLRNWGSTYLGAVTGNNRYFTFSRGDAFELRIPKDELVRISPPGSRHLRGLEFTENDWLTLARAGKPCLLLHPERNDPSEEVKHYLAAGEVTGVQKAYKCRSRRPWWRVPLVPIPDLLLTYMDRDRPRLVANLAQAYHLNSIYGVRLHDDRRSIGTELLPAAALNSVTLLGAELVGRAYGGGILKLEPREADHLPVPSFDLVSGLATTLQELREFQIEALRRDDLAGAVEAGDQALLSGALGLTSDAVQQVRSAREVLFRRRTSRGAGGNGTR